MHGVVHDYARSCPVRCVLAAFVFPRSEPHYWGGVCSKGQLGVSRLFDLDHERHSSLGAAKRERLVGVLERNGVHVLEVAVRTALDHTASKLGLLIGSWKSTMESEIR